MERNVLITLYHQVNKFPGWLSGVKKSFDLSNKDTEFLEQIDDEFIQSCSLNKKDQREIQKMEQEYRWGILDAESDDERIGILSQNISQFNLDYEGSFKRDEPYLTRLLMKKMREVDEMEQTRRRLRFKQVKQIKTNVPSTRISDDQISRARDYSLESLVGTPNKHGYILCPWHDDKKPSMWIKNNYGWCFSCQTWVDPIKWCMTFRRMSFAESVRFLST